MTELSMPETKAVTEDLSAAFVEFRRGFESYKEENERRFRDIEKRGAADCLTEEKLARIDAALDENRRRSDELALKNARPQLARTAGFAEDSQAREHKQAFDAYMRAGEFSGLKALEQKALSAGSGPDGGYLAPSRRKRC